MSDIQSSSLYREVEKITQSGEKPVHFVWSADIHVDKDTYKPLKVLSIDVLSDYEMKFGDEILVRLAISGGTYAKRIYPFKNKVEITLYKHPLSESGEMVDQEVNLESERYTATIIDTGNPLIEANGPNTPTEESLNLTNIFEVTFQLVNKALEQIRLIGVGGIYRNVTVEDVLKGVLTNESKKLPIDKNRLPKGVDIVPVSNKDKRTHVIIPQGTMLVDLPDHIQHKCGGVYGSGLGHYISGDYWYLFPCYDTTRFSISKRTLTVINLPPNKLPHIERTYRKDGTNLVILATGETKFKDDSEAVQLNEGNGVRFAHADKFMTDFVKVSNNKAVAARKTSNSEFVAAKRPTGINNVRVSETQITANPYVQSSKLSRGQGSFFSFIWENSNPSLLYPGMMVKILYYEDDEIREIYGVLLKSHTYVQSKYQGLMNGRHLSRTFVSVFVKQPKK